jgi:hypothetical protein
MNAGKAKFCSRAKIRRSRECSTPSRKERGRSARAARPCISCGVSLIRERHRRCSSAPAKRAVARPRVFSVAFFLKPSGPRFRAPGEWRDFRPAAPSPPFGKRAFQARALSSRAPGVPHSSHRRQRPVVGADGYPKGSRCTGLRNPDSRRHTLPRITNASRNAPQMGKVIGL